MVKVISIRKLSPLLIYPSFSFYNYTTIVVCHMVCLSLSSYPKFFCFVFKSARNNPLKKSFIEYCSLVKYKMLIVYSL